MIEVTAKGRYRLSVQGAAFSEHNQEREGIEKSAKILGADPSLVCTLTPPMIEVRASAQVVSVPSSEPVVSDGGVDLIDFIRGNTAVPPRNPVPLQGDNLWETTKAFAMRCWEDWLLHRLYFTYTDGSEEWVGIGWRGYVLLFVWRDRESLKVGGGA